jgi:anti-sigma regulatory factor (Ser/Thr protein kinase)
MQGNGSAPTPRVNGAAPHVGRETLETTCARQASELHMLADTLAVFRNGAMELLIANVAIQKQLARERAPRLARDVVTDEVDLALDDRAPRAARVAVDAALPGHVTPAILDDARLIVTELVANSVRHSGAPSPARLVLRIARSPTILRLELEDPGRDGVISVGLPDRSAGNGFGLNLVQMISERWGAERVATGGTRVWSQLALDTPAANAAGAGS